MKNTYTMHVRSSAPNNIEIIYLMSSLNCRTIEYKNYSINVPIYAKMYVMYMFII